MPFCRHVPGGLPVTIPADAEVAKLQQENKELRAEVREWLCTECNQVYPGPPQEGFHCVLCPRCDGLTMPHNTWEIRTLRAKLVLRQEAVDLAQERRKKVQELVTQYGMIDGAHHKQWVIDQVMRTLLGAELYKSWVKDMNIMRDVDGELYDPWDEGIAP